VVVSALILALVAAPDAFVVFEGTAPMRVQPLQTPTGMRRFLPQTEDRLTRVEVDDHQAFDRWLRGAGLSAVKHGAQRQWLPVVLARGDRAALARYGRVEATALDGVFRVHLGPGLVDPQAIATAAAAHSVWAEPDEWIRFETRAVSFDDPFFPQLWHLHQTTNPRVAAGVHIRADEAWDLSRGTSAQGREIVGVLDDGFDMQHPDLQPQLITDANGPVAYDYAEGDADPSPHPGDGHGTKVFGVAAAAAGNGVGVVGVCPECQVIPVRIFTSGSDFNPTQLYGAMSVAADGMKFVADRGARVINNSWGPAVSPVDPVYAPMPQYVKDTIYAIARKGPAGAEGSQGVLIVWAGGNNPGQVATFDGWVTDPRTIAVGAINSTGTLASYSNIGPPIRLMAPSSDASRMLPYITTTDGPSGYIQTFGGTSAAAPMVSGTAALVLAQNPTFSLAQLTEVLLDSARKVTPDLAKYGRDGKSCTRGYGLVDARAALELAAARATTYASGHTLHTEVCEDGLDNDNNPMTPDTTGACTRCIPTNAHDPQNGLDDDCDGYVDNTSPCTPNGKNRCEICASTAECQIDFACAPRPDGSRCLRACSATNPCAYLEVCVSGVCLPTKDGTTALECGAYTACVQTNNGIEICDGLDNDCNGDIDDVPMQGPDALSQKELCTRDLVGVCAMRSPLCVAGVWTCSEPDPSLLQDTETLCDGLDNDCDGVVDEGCAPPPPPPKKKTCSAAIGSEAWLAILTLLFVRVVRRRAS
jgi:hypothetical protein